MQQESQTSNNKRIAKNTLLLYIRMFFIMAVSLYTSRVVLQVLGVEDFGIYNVVGGIIAMLGILNGSMSVSTQRYLTFELGRGDMTKLKQTFSVCLSIFVIIALITVLLAESVGIWFLNTQLTIPDNRIVAANWVFQFTIISSVFNLLVTPYNASIIAHEKMDVYAYLSILDVVLKLAIVYVLTIFNMDKLVLYGFLLMLLFVLDTLIYMIYCYKHYSETKYQFYWDKALFKQIGAYSFWNLFGSLAALAKGQGLNILLNIFFTPTVNAARGIAYQVNGVVSQFFMNFFTAVRPQITKYYAQNDLSNMFSLIFRSSKFAYYLILLISLPIYIEAPFIINLWLGQLPEYTVEFVRLVIVVTAIDSTSNPMMTTAHATGRIKLYQSLVGILIILNIPISYVVLKLGGTPISVFVISIMLSTIAFFVRIWIVKRLITSFPVKDYLVKVCGTIMAVTIAAAVVPCVYHLYFELDLVTSILNCLLCLLFTVLAVYFVGMNKGERSFIVNAIKNKIHK